MRTITFLTVLVGLLAGTGCTSSVEPPVPEPPADPALSLVLRPYGVDRQRALLTPVRSADDQEALQGRERLLQSADMRVGDVRFQNRPADSVEIDLEGEDYNYYSDSLDVKLGQTYDLTVQLEEGRTIEGQATVPGSFQGDAQGMRIFWEESAGAARYRLTVEAAEDNPGDFYEQTLTDDTSLVIQPDEEFVEGRYFVTIDALGENLSAFVLDEASRAGLEGAYGVFGAVTTARGIINLERGENNATSKPATFRLRPPR